MQTDTRPRLQSLLHIARKFYLTPGVIAYSLILILVVVAADVAMPWMVKIVIDTIMDGRGATPIAAIFRDVLWMCGVILAVAAVQYLSSALLNRYYNRIVYRGSARLRERLYGRIQAQSQNFLAERKIGEFLTHLVTDVQNLQDSTLDLVSEVPFDVCTLLGLMAAMLFLNPFLALIFALFLASSVLFAFVLGQRGWKAQHSAMQGTADLTVRMQEGLTAARTLSALDASHEEQRHLEEASRRHTAHLEKSGAVNAAVAPFLGFAEYSGIVIVLIFGGWAMLHGSLTAGGLVAFLAYMELAADPMSRFSRVIPRLQKASVSAARLDDLMKITRDTDDRPDALAPADVKGEIAVEGVNYRYPAAPRRALNGLNCRVEAGEKVAVVGRNASGKSTLLDLLLRIQEPEQGHIAVDGMDLCGIRLSAWRRLIGVVPQDILLLNRSVAENIALGSAASPQRIREAAAAAGLDEFISGLPQGYETVAGERGVFLSGGQRQRIAIARLFLRSPRIVLLDEPTSALDVTYERDLLSALRHLCMDRTTFIVSHRPAMLSDVDKVLLLDAGEQLAFDTPARVWQDFPEFRDLFPESWASAKSKPSPAMPDRTDTSSRQQPFHRRDPAERHKLGVQ